MSLEAQIEKLIGAVDDLTSAVEKQTKLVEGGIAKSAGKSTTSTSTTKPLLKKNQKRLLPKRKRQPSPQ